MAATFSFSFLTFNAYGSEAFSGFSLKGLNILLRLGVAIRASNYNTSVSGAEFILHRIFYFKKWPDSGHAAQVSGFLLSSPALCNFSPCQK